MKAESCEFMLLLFIILSLLKEVQVIKKINYFKILAGISNFLSKLVLINGSFHKLCIKSKI